MSDYHAKADCQSVFGNADDFCVMGHRGWLEDIGFVLGRHDENSEWWHLGRIPSTDPEDYDRITKPNVTIHFWFSPSRDRPPRSWLYVGHYKVCEDPTRLRVRLLLYAMGLWSRWEPGTEMNEDRRRREGRE